MPYASSPLAPRGGERALTIPGLADVLGPDAFSNPRYHGYGECDEETRQQLRSVRDAPEALVRIYRAIPSAIGQINPGDWVTLSQDYARQHAMRDDDAANDWPIVFADVPARMVVTDGKDLDQYGYAGPPLTRLRDSVAGDALTS